MLKHNIVYQKWKIILRVIKLKNNHNKFNKFNNNNQINQ